MTKFLNISTDNTLGGDSPSDEVVSSQKAIKDYVDTGLSGLATVATSGSYNDLSNKPTIPTVNNATLTITQGGTTKGTFTANASSDVTIALDAGGGGGLPSQTGNAGKFLTTDGTDASWDIAVKSVNNISPINGNVTLSNLADTNLSNLTVTGKETATSLGMPDYTAGIAKTVGTSYTAEQNGFIKIDIVNSSWGSLVIDGISIIGTLTNSANLCALSFIYPIAKGQVYNASGVFSITFYPAKGG